MICWSKRIVTLRWFVFSNASWNQHRRKYSKFRLFCRARTPSIVSNIRVRTKAARYPLTLHFYYVYKALQMLSLSSSIFSMAWCIASYHRCIRFSQIDKINISWIGSIVQSSWLLSITSEFAQFINEITWHNELIQFNAFPVSRVFSIAIVASIFHKWYVCRLCYADCIPWPFSGVTI